MNVRLKLAALLHAILYSRTLIVDQTIYYSANACPRFAATAPLRQTPVPLRSAAAAGAAAPPLPPTVSSAGSPGARCFFNLAALEAAWVRDNKRVGLAFILHPAARRPLIRLSFAMWSAC